MLGVYYSGMTNFLKLTADRAASAWDPTELNYASLTQGRAIRNTQTSETGVITGTGNGDVVITLTSGPDADELITVRPDEAISFWRKIL